MIFNSHSELLNRHAFLSPSNYHWINYSDEKLEARFISAMAARRGSDLHALAHEAIRLGITLADNNQSLAAYVNDGIGYKMNCEQPLFYSENCFGKADTICFRSDTLRIHDLKTGIINTSEHQLEIYAALFCLEYSTNPYDIGVELRIYQREDIRVYNPSPELLIEIMERIVYFDQQIELMKASDRI